jgi:hypothetical protein
MSVRKTFSFTGTVTSAKGWLRRQVIGKPVSGVIWVTGNAADFPAPIRKAFTVGGQITQAPLIGSMFPGKDIKADGYPYVLKSYDVVDVIETDSAKVNVFLTVVPDWSKLDKIKTLGSPKAWLYRIMASDMVVEGVATFVGDTTFLESGRK